VTVILSETPFNLSIFAPGVLFGGNPLTCDDVAKLVANGVTHLIDLREQWEWMGPGRDGAEAILALEDANVERLWLPTCDGGNPTSDTLERAVLFIDAAVVAGKVFVHCRAGRERTGAVLLAWTLSRGGDANRLRERAPLLRPLAGQQQAVYDWWRNRF